MRWLVMDPGGKNFACTLLENDIPLWFGYHPIVKFFKISDMEIYNAFLKATKIMYKKADCLIIERYVQRRPIRGLSQEGLNTMIANVITLALEKNKIIFPLTASSWKSKVDYDVCINFGRRIGYLKGDQHFMDTMLMYSIVTKQRYPKIFKNGLEAYNIFKEKQKKRRKKERK